MRLAEGSFINNVARLEKSEDIEKISEEMDKEIASESTPKKEEPARENLDSEEDSF